MSLPLIEGKYIRKKYGLQVVLDELSFLISDKQKIALIGRNGAGKSTLLKIITGAEEADGGEVAFYPSAKLGIVNQHEILPSCGTTLEFLESKGKKPEWEIRKQAAQFGLSLEHLKQVPGDLSGGYQMRVKLVAMLLKDPTILLLDEPVNYLDLQTLLLLERFLQTYRGSYIIAAHDRTFLQNTCTTTYEIERGKLVTYNGTVEEYLTYKQEQLEFQMGTNKKLKREIAHHQTFVDRFRYKASLASRAQSKLKHIAKLRNKITAIDSTLATTHVVIPSPQHVPGPAVRTDDLIIGYGDRVVARAINLDLMRGEKIVIVGENGNGKSTLLKTLARIIEPLGGSVKWWHKADIGYYDQKTDATLVASGTVLQHLTRMGPDDAAGEQILMMAGNFLFKGDDLDKPVSVLSGGERARLCLAGILLRKHNVLLLDEPTNHLDVETTEALALALKKYSGTILFISHARTFVNAIAEKIFEVRGGKVKPFTGSYEEYVQAIGKQVDKSTQEVFGQDQENHKNTTDRAFLQLEIKKHQRSLARVEKMLETFKVEKERILQFFIENPTTYVPDKVRRLNKLNQEIVECEQIWITDQEAIEKFRNQL